MRSKEERAQKAAERNAKYEARMAEIKAKHKTRMAEIDAKHDARAEKIKKRSNEQTGLSNQFDMM